MATLGAQPATHLEPVQVGQHDIEDDEVGLRAGDGVEGGATARHGDDPEAVVPQSGIEHRSKVVLVVDEEQSFAGHGLRMDAVPESTP